jgi:16S rRNA (cytosine1402-N4)-methyltransferase
MDEAGKGLLHQPVLLAECIEALNIRADGVYIDGTFGRGGHSAQILTQLSAAGRLIALDTDPQAVTAGRQLGGEWRTRASEHGADLGRFDIVHARFSQLVEVLDALGVPSIDGILLDLGVSSPQLDDPSRGFSFRFDGPLDMRMDPTRGMSARQWLLQASERQITEALRNYGEERFAVEIAAAIVARCRDAGVTALSTTGELASLVAGIVRRRQKRSQMGKDPATRTFQAIRILVNQELEELAIVLELATARLRPGGRLAVISFHSLEDRIVKQFMARESGRFEVRKDPIRGTPIYDKPLRLHTLPRVLPSEQEIKINPRSRSAVLRVAKRVDVALGATE